MYLHISTPIYTYLQLFVTKTVYSVSVSIQRHKAAPEDTAKQPEPEPQEPQEGPKALWALVRSCDLVPVLCNDFVELSAYYRVFFCQFQGRILVHEKYIPIIPKVYSFPQCPALPTILERIQNDLSGERLFC